MNIALIAVPFIIIMGGNFFMENRGMFAIPEDELIPRYIELERRSKKRRKHVK